MPAPIPNGEAEDAVRLSLSSFSNKWSLGKYAAQLIIGFTDRERLDEQTRVAELAFIAAVAASSPSAVGVYFGQTTQKIGLVLDLAKLQSLLGLVMLEVGFSVERDSTGTMSFLSQGMQERFSRPELLMKTRKGGAGIAAFFDLLVAVIENGGPFPDGDTIGRTTDERYRITYVHSPFQGEPDVWSVNVPRW
jgi:hypothetical protein